MQAGQRGYLLLPGISGGLATDFMKNIQMDVLGDKSYLAVSFKYFEAGGQPSEGLVDEIEAVQAAVDALRQMNQKITIIGKSLGSISASHWLERHTPESTADIDLIVLGYVIGDVATAALKDRLSLVIQGEGDRFGNAQAVRDHLAAHSVEAPVIGIEDADHSYRTISDGLNHEAEVIAALKQHLN